MYLRIHGFIALFVSILSASAASSTVAGVTNYADVDQKVCRGAQPTDEGFKHLSDLGVKVVIDLREHDDRSIAEERVVTADGMRYINVPMTGMTPPTRDEMKTILALLEDASPDRVFVHCKRGADRTGAVIAAYRVDHDGWENGRALREAMDRGMSSFQFQRQKFIRSYQAGVKDDGVATTAAVVGVKN